MLSEGEGLGGWLLLRGYFACVCFGTVASRGLADTCQWTGPFVVGKDNFFCRSPCSISLSSSCRRVSTATARYPKPARAWIRFLRFNSDRNQSAHSGSAGSPKYRTREDQTNIGSSLNEQQPILLGIADHLLR